MISFVLFLQASQPCMNFNISELVYYRPVSVLPAFSKIVEKVMYNTLKFLNDHNILSDNQ